MNKYPEYIEVAGKKYKINTDFRLALKCDDIFRDETIGNYEKFLAIIYILLGKEGLKCTKYKIMAPEQSQKQQPGMEYLMTPQPIFDNPNYKGSGKLQGKVAIITGGDSGLGRAAAIAFVKEGAKVVIPYYNEHKDAKETKEYIERLGGECLLLSGDITDKNFCQYIVNETLKKFNKIDVLVNNAGVQYQQDCLENISDEQFDRTLKVNLYGMFYLTKKVF